MGWDWRLLAALFLVAKVVGVLPVNWNTHINYRLHLCGQDRDCFSASWRWKLVTILQVIFIVYLTYSSFTKIPLQILKSLFGVVWVFANGSAVCSLLLVHFYEPKMLVKCCSMACKIYTLPSRYERTIPRKLFALLIIYPFITIFYLIIVGLLTDLTLDSFILILKSNYLYTPSAGVEVVVTILCFISSRAYIYINKQMQKLRKVNKKTFKHFISLLESHIFVSRFCKLFSVLFSPHFLNIFFIYILRMICFAIILIEQVKAGRIWDMSPILIHVLYVTARLFFLCHWCQKVTVQLDGYEEMMLNCEVEFTACGMFPINLQQILNVLGLIVTYSLVALQTK